MNATPVGWTKHYFQRIFRRGKAKFEGTVHNQLVYKGSVLQTEIVVYHYGYNLSKEQMRNKFKRTEDLLRKQLECDSTNPFSYMNLARVLKTQHRHAEVIQTAEKGHVVTQTVLRDKLQQRTRIIDVRNKRGRDRP